MTIHLYTFSGVRGGSSRQRAFRVADELRKRGHVITIHEPAVLDITRTPWPKKLKCILQVISGLSTIKKGDIVFLQRTVANKYFFIIMVTYLFFSRRKMLFDFDDPIYLHSYIKTKILTQMADAVITCSHVQKEWALQFNQNVTVIHIALAMSDYERFTKDYTAPPSPIVIGWTGTGPEHLRNLELLVPIFTRLLERDVPSFVFVLIGALADKNVYALFENIPGLAITFVDSLDWENPDSTPREIQKFDIGIVPHQQDGEWNRAKTSFKVLEYMACGVATIVSEFGEMPCIIKNGENGYIAANEDEWVEKLETLLLEPVLRAELGRKGQERVREAYCYDATIPLYEQVIESVQGTV